MHNCIFQFHLSPLCRNHHQRTLLAVFFSIAKISLVLFLSLGSATQHAPVFSRQTCPSLGSCSAPAAVPKHFGGSCHKRGRQGVWSNLQFTFQYDKNPFYKNKSTSAPASDPTTAVTDDEGRCLSCHNPHRPRPRPPPSPQDP